MRDAPQKKAFSFTPTKKKRGLNPNCGGYPIKMEKSSHLTRGRLLKTRGEKNSPIWGTTGHLSSDRGNKEREKLTRKA